MYSMNGSCLQLTQVQYVTETVSPAIRNDTKGHEQ